MSCIIYRDVKGSRYAYESESYWDPVKKAPRTRRKYLGKVDQETGEIIRVYKKPEKAEKPNEAADDTRLAALSAELEKLQKEVEQLREQNASLTKKILTLKEVFDSVS